MKELLNLYNIVQMRLNLSISVPNHSNLNLCLEKSKDHTILLINKEAIADDVLFLSNLDLFNFWRLRLVETKTQKMIWNLS